MAKQTILTERGTGEVMYPQTLASLVQTADGGNVDEGLGKARFALFDDEWALSQGTVIEPGELYELNGTTGITYPEAMRIMDCRLQQVESTTSLQTAFDASVVGVLKAVFPFKSKYRTGTTQFLCFGQKLITKFIWPTNGTTTNAQFMFDGCAALKEIKGTIIFEHGCNVEHTFRACAALEEVRIILRRSAISLADSPKLSINSIRGIGKESTLQAATITVHPDVYAKLTGDTTNAAAAALTPEELAQWQQLLTDAAAKNITFATT